MFPWKKVILVWNQTWQKNKNKSMITEFRFWGEPCLYSKLYKLSHTSSFDKVNFSLCYPCGILCQANDSCQITQGLLNRDLKQNPECAWLDTLWSGIAIPQREAQPYMFLLIIYLLSRAKTTTFPEPNLLLFHSLSNDWPVFHIDIASPF